MTSVAEALRTTRGVIPLNEARLLLGKVLSCLPVWLLTHDDFVLDEPSLYAFQTLVARRAVGEPVAYLVGTREFFGHEFLSSPAVLIPRPETELLVDVANARIGARKFTSEAPCVRVLDLGTGSGCIAISLALEHPSINVFAVDYSEAALAIARVNAERLGARVSFVKSHWFAAVESDGFDLIVTNPPYIARSNPHLEQGDLRFEPADALIGGDDGLEALRRIIAAATNYLTASGELWLEHGYDQSEAVGGLLVAAGFVDIKQYRDIAGIVRVSGGRRVCI